MGTVSSLALGQSRCPPLLHPPPPACRHDCLPSPPPCPAAPFFWRLLYDQLLPGSCTLNIRTMSTAPSRFPPAVAPDFWAVLPGVSCSLAVPTLVRLLMADLRRWLLRSSPWPPRLPSRSRAGYPQALSCPVAPPPPSACFACLLTLFLLLRIRATGKSRPLRSTL